MATRTRRTTPGGRPVRTLVLLAALVIALFAAIGASAALGNPAGQWSPKLGLDLEGGRQIVLQPSVGKGQTVTTGQVDQAIDIIRERVNGNGVSEAQVSRLGAKNIQVSLPGNPSQETLNSLAQSSQLFFRAVINSTQDTPATFTLPTPYTAPTTKGSTTPKSTTSPSSTATPSGTSSSSSSSSSSSTANDVLPQAFRAATTTPTPSTSSTAAPSSTSPSATASSTPQATASSTTPARTLPTPYDPSGNVTTNGLGASDTGWESRTVSDDWVTAGLATKGATYSQLLTAYSCSGPTAAQWQQVARQIPASQPTVGCDTGTSISGAQAPATKYLMGPSEVTGRQITDASFGQATTQQGVTTGQYEVNLTFDSKGSSEFAKVTGRLNGLQAPRNQFGIVVDGLVISAPSNTNGAITGGKAQITGNFTENSAKTLANQLRFGALPFSFSELTSSQVSPQLGSQQLRDGIIAGIIGLILVVLYSLAQYRLLGLVTIASLVTSAVITYGAVTLLGYTANLRLTMAGVTGLIVAIGITADSFIVYFERVRDEVRSGRPLRAAVQTGWSRARRTVLVSDAVNFLAAAVLYILSEDNVKAFAFTLGLTTLIDILVVFLFTHPVLTLLSRTSFFGNGHKWSGFDPERLGARGVTYAGRGRVTIAERKAAAAAGKQA